MFPRRCRTASIRRTARQMWTRSSTDWAGHYEPYRPTSTLTMIYSAASTAAVAKPFTELYTSEPLRRPRHAWVRSIKAFCHGIWIGMS